MRPRGTMLVQAQPGPRDQIEHATDQPLHHVSESVGALIFQATFDKGQVGGRVRMSGNPAALFGFASGTVLTGLHELLEAVHPEDRNAFESFQKALTPSGQADLEWQDDTCTGRWRYRVVTHDGRLRWLQAETWVELDAVGRLVGTTGVIRDITDVQRAQQQQLEVRKRLEAVFDHTFEFIGLLEPNGTLIEVNRTALSFAGVERDQVIGKPFWQTPWWSNSELEQSRLRDGIRRAAEGAFARFETWHTDPGGRKVTIDFSLKPVQDETNRVVLIIAEGRDITARVRGESERERLLEQFAFERGQFEVMLEQMPLGVGIINAVTQRISFVNAALERVLGCPILPGQHLERLGQRAVDRHGQPIAPLERIFRATFERGEPVTGLEFTIEHDDGRRVNVVASGTPIKDASDQTVACVITCTDISQPRRAQLEDRLEDALEHVREHHTPTAPITAEGLVEALADLYQRGGASPLEGRLIGLLLLRAEPISLTEAAQQLGVTKVSISRTVKPLRDRGDVLVWHDPSSREHRFALAAGVYVRDLLDWRGLSWAMAGVLDKLANTSDLSEVVTRRLRTQLEAHIRTASSLEHHLRAIEQAQERALRQHLEDQ